MFEQEFIVKEGTITSVFSSEEEISIPSEIDGVHVTGIGNSAFYGCDNLRSIVIPDSVTFVRNK